MVEKLVYSTEEAADALGVCASTVRNMCAEGKLPHIRLGTKGRRTVIPIKALNDFVDAASRARRADEVVGATVECALANP